ncbi:MAG: amidohydrolase family protein [Pyrinomonadaceae bacterium]
MKFVFVLVFLTGFLVSASLAQQNVDVLVKDISVFDPRSGMMLPRRDIVISDTKIVAILPSGKFKGKAKTTVNGSGKYALPGLFDNHVHIARLTEQSAGLFLAFGVTSVRDMGTVPSKIEAWRKKIAYGKFYGPRIVQACGPMLESGGEERKDHWVVSGPEMAREVASRVAEAGMDCIKLRTFKDRETYLAIAAAAKDKGLMFTGHAPESIDPIVALNAGQRTFEHAFYPYPLSKLSAEEKQKLVALFVANKAAIVPTLVAWKPFTEQTMEIEQKTSRFQLGIPVTLPTELLAHWVNQIEIHRKQNLGSKDWLDAVKTASRDVGEMSSAGVTILPGSDTGAPFVVPGVAIHEELMLLVSDAGLSPTQALKAATIESAAFYGREADLGSIEVGKIADLMILDKDPLADIRNTLAIDAVIFRGEPLPKAKLNILLGPSKE